MGPLPVRCSTGSRTGRRVTGLNTSAGGSRPGREIATKLRMDGPSASSPPTTPTPNNLKQRPRRRKLNAHLRFLPIERLVPGKFEGTVEYHWHDGLEELVRVRHATHGRLGRAESLFAALAPDRHEAIQRRVRVGVGRAIADAKEGQPFHRPDERDDGGEGYEEWASVEPRRNEVYGVEGRWGVELLEVVEE